MGAAMIDGNEKDKPVAATRRETLKRVGRFVAVSAPAVTLALALKSKPALALTSIAG
jgi:hypothetical protein